MVKTIALLDPHKAGHHQMYLRLFSKILLDLGYRVLAFSAEPDSLRQWMTGHCPEQAQNLETFPMQKLAPAQVPLLGRLPQPVNGIMRWQQAATIAKTAQDFLGQAPDLIFFNWLDDYFSAYLPAPLLDQLFPYPWAGLCFQPRLSFGSSHTKNTNKQGWVDFHAALNARHCRGVGVLDEGMAMALQQQSCSPVVTFPDITDASEPDRSFSVRQQLQQQAQGRTIIGLLGSLNRRKGLLTLLEIARRSQHQPWYFAFIGKLSSYGLSAAEVEHIQTLAQQPPENCFFHLQLIPDEPQFNALVEACDILFAAYENFPYSSNLLTKAAVFQKPVIVSEEFCMGQRVQQFRLGCTMPQGNVHQGITAIHQLTEELATGMTTLRPNFSGYRQQHSIHQVQLALQEILGNV
ncbi:MAG TPA: hypothetical protein V6C65_09745 [Allocoleopsis sp.]